VLPLQDCEQQLVHLKPVNYKRAQVNKRSQVSDGCDHFGSPGSLGLNFEDHGKGVVEKVRGREKS
jgi:hypothetical protein